MPNISKTNLKAVRLPIPPLPLQTQFANIVEKVEALRSRHQESLTDLEALYGALSQRAFKGELDLSRVPLPNTERQEAQTSLTAASPTPDVLPAAADLPDTDLMLAALDDRTTLKELLRFWIEGYCARLNGAAFSAQAFLTSAQTRIAELHPDGDFELGADAYEHVKAWVFDKIKSRELKQTRDIVSIGGKRNFGNKVVLRARGSSLS